MLLKNAGLESQREMRQSLEAGKVFYTAGMNRKKVFFDSDYAYNRQSPYRIETLNGNSDGLFGIWTEFRRLLVESKWYDDCGTGVPCRVRDGEEWEGQIEIIKRRTENGFLDIRNGLWEYAIPIQPSDCLQTEE